MLLHYTPHTHIHTDATQWLGSHGVAAMFLTLGCFLQMSLEQSVIGNTYNPST